jgi:hypothetical protein
MSEALAIALMLIPLTENYHGIDEPGSHGKYQIRQVYLDDVNKFSGCNYTIADCYNDKFAKRIVTIYLQHYGSKIGHQPSARDLCRIHNGGPDGWKEHCTLAYWQKAKLFLYVARNELKGKKEA